MQSRSRRLDNDWRRGADTNHYLRVCRAKAQRDPAYRDEQPVLDRHQTSGIANGAITAYTKSPDLLRNHGHDLVTIRGQESGKGKLMIHLRT
jgi:hypothetical protein